MRHRTILAITVTSLAVLEACASLHDASRPFRDGWRQGIVTQIAPATAFSRATYDCRDRMLVDEKGEARFARVTFHHTSMKVAMLVAVPHDGEVQAGDQVHVKFNDCRVPPQSSNKLKPR